MSLPDGYDVNEAARLLRWVGDYASNPGNPGLRMLLEDIKAFLDNICPTCHGAGRYFIAEDEQEPCDDCGMWMRNDGDAVTTDAF